MSQMKAWSFSSLKHYEQCPKSYHAQRIAKTHKQPHAEHLDWGNLVHKHLEDRVNDKIPLPDFLEHLEPVIAGLEASGKVLIAELAFAFNRNWQPTDYWAKEAYTRGKIDIVAIGKDEAIIIDWKTGKRRPDFGQLEYYSLAMGLIGIKVVKCFFVWTATREHDEATVIEAQFEVIKERFDKKASELENSINTGVFPAKTSALCPWCPVVYDCEEARAKKYHLKAKHMRKASEG